MKTAPDHTPSTWCARPARRSRRPRRRQPRTRPSADRRPRRPLRGALAARAGRRQKTTFENYRKDAERLLLWAIVQLGKPLSSLTHEDLLLSREFLNDPQPHARWVADDGRK
ncbi:hypothetical protein PTKU46_82780 [Paraburkholderia terrae]